MLRVFRSASYPVDSNPDSKVKKKKKEQLFTEKDARRSADIFATLPKNGKLRQTIGELFKKE